MKLNLPQKRQYKPGELLKRERDNKLALVVSVEEKSEHRRRVFYLELLIDGQRQRLRDVEVIANFLTVS